MQRESKIKFIDFQSNISTDLKQFYVTSTINCINLASNLDSFYLELLTDINYCQWLIDNPNVLNSVYHLLLLYYTDNQKYLQHICKYVNI